MQYLHAFSRLVRLLQKGPRYKADIGERKVLSRQIKLLFARSVNKNLFAGEHTDQINDAIAPSSFDAMFGYFGIS